MSDGHDKPATGASTGTDRVEDEVRPDASTPPPVSSPATDDTPADPATVAESAEAVPVAATPEDSGQAPPAVEPTEVASTDASTKDATPDEEAAEGTTDEKAESQEAAAKRKPRFPAVVRAFRSGRLISGTVEKVIKGGYEVRVGRARGFCPHSQIDLHRENDPERQVGKSYQFKITQLRRGGEDIVLSRRAVLEEERSEEGKAVRATLIEGAVMQGRVVGTAPFGAFVDLGAGVLGLAHISELSHKRVNSVDEAVTVGDTVPVRILKLKETGRISLSIRRAVDDPWADVDKRFVVGQVYPGTVQRVADFGAFVELAPGVDALAPASEFPPTSAGWKEGLEVGSSRDWHVLSVDRRARRLSVTPPGEAGVPADAITVGVELVGQVQRIERYGVFLWLGPGRVGLMPRAMTGVGEGGDLRRQFRIGDKVEVDVVGLEDDGRRIRLCRKGVKPEPAEPPQRSKAPEQLPSTDPPEAFGTSLADKLRAALGKADGSS